jgi:ABC-2 type transport system permease protein
MREVLALTRASWQVMTSYRLGFLLSIAGLIAGVIPMFFIADALQPVVADSIRDEGGQYFGFLLLGYVAYTFLLPAVGALPGAMAGGIASGTLEALLNTPARLPFLLLGFSSAQMALIAVRAAVMLAAGAVLGAGFVVAGFGWGIPVLILIIAAYLPFGLISAALVLVFRTPTPLNTGVLAVSALLGGVYYSTSVIPSWMGYLPPFVPLTYGLRALRRAMLQGAGFTDIAGDLGMLVLLAAVLWLVGTAAFLAGLRYARRAGTLSHY